MNVIRKLPKSVQSLICASNEINTYTKAVQELVFNALDAAATSIAVRVHIAKGTIQIVDNGCGISQVDFNLIGQNYMTSKLVDISTLKSAPNKYGFQGQSLANLVQISETVKLTSRFYKCQTTFEKTFENGKARSTAKCNPRPSKGTTVEIKGFLYNLSIQKKSVDLINELQSIKTFLEHISLVHSNISLSLRDDSKNEIVYKIHKNRDLYQTLTTLYEIEKTKVQELQVEKNQYKVKAYVGKGNVEIKKQLIFLNGKFISESSLIHKKVNENFKRRVKGTNKKIKKNLNNNEENHIFGKEILFYLIFIICPYMDYELTDTVLEFKDWGQINTILEKLVKFYIGNIPVQKVPTNQITRLNNKRETESTRKHIEEIMQKILGNQCKKPGISQMQNGIKGKLIKRKPKQKKDLSKTRDSKKYNKTKYISELGSSDKTIRSINAQNANKNETGLKLSSKPNDNDKNSSVRPAFKKTSVNKPNIARKLKPTSKIKTQKRLCRNKTNKSIKRTYKPCLNKVSLNNKFAMETESVKRRCELLARKTEDFIKNNRRNPEVFINENIQYIRTNFMKNNKNVGIHAKVNEIVLHEYIPRLPKSSVVNQNGNNGKNKLFKSNYDLLQTIISSQQESSNPGHWINYVQNYSIPENETPFKPEVKKIDDGPSAKTESSERFHVPLFRDVNDPTPFQVEISDHSSRVFVGSDNRRVSSFREMTPDFSLRPFSKESGETNFVEELPENYHSQERESGNHIIFQVDTPDRNVSPSVKEPSDVSPLQTDTIDSIVRPYLMRSSDDTSPVKLVTFQSHNYYTHDGTESDVELNNIYIKPRSFIKTQSRENFINFHADNRVKANRTNMFSKLFKLNNRRKIEESKKMFDMENNTVKGIRESYTIEFTESNEYTSRKYNSSRYDMLYSANQTNIESIDTITPTMNYIFNDPRTRLISKCNNENDSVLNYEPLNKNTYTITNSYNDNNEMISSKDENWNHDGTYTIESSSKLGYTSEISKTTQYSDNNENESTKFVFISKSQENDGEIQITNAIDLCETILRDQELSKDGELEFDISFICKQDSCKNLSASCEKNNTTEMLNQEEIKETSHHFTLSNNISKRQSPILIQKHDPISKAERSEKTITNEPSHYEQNKDVTIVNEFVNKKNDTAVFTIRSRMCFVPKGMSPIFEECQTKPDCDYGPKEDYYADKMYNDFVGKVQSDIEIFKPRIRDSSDHTTKDISKVNNRLNKDSSSLKFDGLCIKNATVLGQVDSKFIAATMKRKGHKSGHEEFLVLFDQHAVHERIRLENNLSDYLTDSQWKSVPIDEVTLKISKDHIIYLHNYRDKFKQFGLQWNLLNYNEISITAIPEGILGKNPRQVDKIIKAVKNLITEEINIIQMQRGCVSLYPKSIMELVFSEACRYAIKFGDHLSRSQCIELISGLSECKTPFQCAHGRPAMAVIMNIECNKAEYKIDFKKIKPFKNI